MIGILLISVIIGLYHGYKRDLIQWFQKRRLKQADLEMKSADSKNVSLETKDEITEVSNYLTADGKLGILPIALSLVATMVSSNSILANPGIS
jgi:hypothetical protein